MQYLSGFFFFDGTQNNKKCPITPDGNTEEYFVPDKTLNCLLLHTALIDRRWLNGLRRHKRITRLSFELTAAIRMEYPFRNAV